MSIGQLDKLLDLESKTSSKINGEIVDSWAKFATVWGKTTSQRGDESFEAARQNSKELIKIKLRYRADVNTTQRIKFLDNYYYIKYVDKTEYRTGYMWIMAEAVGV